MKLFGLTQSADRSALPCIAGLWVALSLVALILFGLTLIEALVAGLAATPIHLLSVIVHDTGHVIAARSTGHPMIGWRLWTIFATVYPPDEGKLPASIHVKRALGGPIASAILTLVFGTLGLITTQGSALWWLMLFGFVENLFVMTLQALVPLGFNDGAALWKWIPKLGIK